MKYDVISFFSGAGFLDFAFAETNFHIIRGYELVSDFADNNNYNHALRYGTSQDIVIQQDIATLDLYDIPKANGIIGGPPCQDFSIGNANNPGVSGDRGKLIWNYLNVIKHVSPDFFLFENVHTLYTVKRHRTEAFEPLLSHFKEMDYRIYFDILNALEYGVPQDRPRLFIVGVKKQIIETLKRKGLPEFSWPKPTYPNAKEIYSWPDTSKFGKPLSTKELEQFSVVPYELTVQSVIGNEEELSRLPNHVTFRPYSNRFYTVEEGDVKRKSFKRLHRFRYSPTVAYGNNEVHLHPTKARRLTVRESLRLQSVPDWYQFKESTPLGKMFKMVSNGVAFRLAKLLAQEIKIVLDNYHSLNKGAKNSIEVITTK